MVLERLEGGPACPLADEPAQDAEVAVRKIVVVHIDDRAAPLCVLRPKADGVRAARNELEVRAAVRVAQDGLLDQNCASSSIPVRAKGEEDLGVGVLLEKGVLGFALPAVELLEAHHVRVREGRSQLLHLLHLLGALAHAECVAVPRLDREGGRRRDAGLELGEVRPRDAKDKTAQQ